MKQPNIYFRDNKDHSVTVTYKRRRLAVFTNRQASNIFALMYVENCKQGMETLDAALDAIKTLLTTGDLQHQKELTP